MKSPKALLALLILGVASVLCGCTSKTSQDSAMPWSRPATWEGNIPGMGSMEESRR